MYSTTAQSLPSGSAPSRLRAGRRGAQDVSVQLDGQDVGHRLGSDSTPAPPTGTGMIDPVPRQSTVVNS
jgi:hypothetical protein